MTSCLTKRYAATIDNDVHIVSKIGFSDNAELNEYMPLERDYALALMCDTKKVDKLDSENQ